MQGQEFVKSVRWVGLTETN